MTFSVEMFTSHHVILLISTYVFQLNYLSFSDMEMHSIDSTESLKHE